MNFSIIVPFYNEEGNLLQLNKEISDFVIANKKKNFNFELIYVDDCSKDKSLKICSKFQNSFRTKLVKHRMNLSQADSIRTGVSVSNYDNLIFLDADLQNDISDLNEMINIFVEDYDMVIGNRVNRKDNFFSKKLPSLIANKLVRFFTSSKANDHGCAIKILKKKVFLSSSSLGDFHRLLSAEAFNLGFKIKEIDVNHRERFSGSSKYGMSRIFRVLLDLIYLNFMRNYQNRSLYFFGVFSFMSILIASLILIFMFYLKYFENISFIETPLPILGSTFFLMSINFLLIGILAHFNFSKNFEDNKSNKHFIEFEKDIS